MLLIYLDHLIVISSDFATHVSHLREVCDCLQAAGLKLRQLVQPASVAARVEGVPIFVVGRGGATPSVKLAGCSASLPPLAVERSQRVKRPLLLGYLADYHCGHLELQPIGGRDERSGTPIMGKNSEPRTKSSPDSAGQIQKQRPTN